MYTWLFWRALQAPPITNPLFVQVRGIDRPSWLDRAWNLFMGLMLVMLFVKPPIFVIAILLIPIAYPILSSTCYGVIFALRTSSMIFTRRQQGSYDLIRLTPGGAWQAFWGVCAGSVHHNGDLDRLYHYLKRIITILLTMGVFMLIASLVLPTERLKIEFATMGIAVFTVIALMYLELSQLSIISILIGMLFAISARTTVDSRIGALVGFLTVQLTIYLTSAVLILSLLYPRLTTIDISPVIAMLIACTVVLAYISIVRELVMLILWRLISRGLNTAQDDMRYLLTTS